MEDLLDFACSYTAGICLLRTGTSARALCLFTHPVLQRLQGPELSCPELSTDPNASSRKASVYVDAPVVNPTDNTVPPYWITLCVESRRKNTRVGSSFNQCDVVRPGQYL